MAGEKIKAPQFYFLYNNRMRNGSNEVAKWLFGEIKEGDVASAVSLLSRAVEGEKTGKLKFTRTPLLNSIGRELGKLLLREGWKFERLMQLWERGKRDERLIVIAALGEISRREPEKTKEFVQGILDDISDWETCDQLALRVVVNLAVHNRKETFSTMEKWVKSENKWLRRLAVATIPPYIRAKPGESRVCLEFLEKVMREEDRDVKKAVGWALREVSKKAPEEVLLFLKKWAEVEDKNTRWIIKEGMRKLPERARQELKGLIR